MPEEPQSSRTAKRAAKPKQADELGAQARAAEAGSGTESGPGDQAGPATLSREEFDRLRRILRRRYH